VWGPYSTAWGPVCLSAAIFLSNPLVSRTACSVGDVEVLASQASTKLQDAVVEDGVGCNLELFITSQLSRGSP
jgi:hypothetical protein